MAEVAVSSYESGANLKLISKNLRPLFKSVPDSVFVCVGDMIETEEEDYLKGHGTAFVDGRLIATFCGVVKRVNKLIYVESVQSRYTPQVGDVVVGRVTEVQGKRWKVDLNSKQEASLLLSAVNLPGGVQRRRTAEDELNMRKVFKEGDLMAAEVQGKNQDGGIQLHTRTGKFGKLAGGQLVIISAKLVKRQKMHFTTLQGLDVDIIAGLNGLIWVAPHVERLEDGTPAQQQQQQQQQGGEVLDNAAAVAAAAAVAHGPSREQREAVVRVAGAIRALAALMLQVYPGSIVEAFQASIEEGVAVKDMTEQHFLESLARREVLRRTAEAAQAAQMVS